jgi:hemerythrin
VPDAQYPARASTILCNTTIKPKETVMALITWNDSLSVKVAEIDEQHKKLIAMINELNDAMRLGKGKDVLGKIVNGLVTYTTTHF